MALIIGIDNRRARRKEQRFGSIALSFTRCALTLLLLAVLCGCPSAPLMMSAKPIGHLKVEVTTSPGVMAINGALIGEFPNPFSGEEEELPELSKSYYLPDIPVTTRLGIWDYFDIGLNVSGYGRLGLDIKGSPYFNDWFAVAVAPGVALGGVVEGIIDTRYTDFTLPVLVDLAPADWLRLTVAPRYRGIFTTRKATVGGLLPDNYHFFGGGAAIELRFSDSFALVPNATIDQLLDAPAASAGGATVSTRFRLLSAGLGFRVNSSI